jgi:hypothetical protein
MTLLDSIVCFAAIFGFIFMLFGLGEVGYNNVYRVFIMLYAWALAGGYAAQHWLEHKPSDFMGFPLMGIFCWGAIGAMQILHIRMNIRKHAQEEERLQEYRR